MEFIQNTINWIKAEIFEAWLILAFGLFTITAGFLFWKIGSTPGSKALLWPLIISGVIYAGIASGMLFSNQKRMAEFPQSYQQSKKEFVNAEKKRIEDFQYGYKVSKIVATLFFAMTLIIFWTTKNPMWQGIGIGLSYFALTGLMIDYFSQERADIYYSFVLKALQ